MIQNIKSNYFVNSRPSKSDINKKEDEEIKKVIDEMEVAIVKPETITNPIWKVTSNH